MESGHPSKVIYLSQHITCKTCNRSYFCLFIQKQHHDNAPGRKLSNGNCMIMLLLLLNITHLWFFNFSTIILCMVTFHLFLRKNIWLEYNLNWVHRLFLSLPSGVTLCLCSKNKWTLSWKLKLDISATFTVQKLWWLLLSSEVTLCLSLRGININLKWWLETDQIDLH